MIERGASCIYGCRSKRRYDRCRRSGSGETRVTRGEAEAGGAEPALFRNLTRLIECVTRPHNRSHSLDATVTQDSAGKPYGVIVPLATHRSPRLTLTAPYTLQASYAHRSSPRLTHTPRSFPRCAPLVHTALCVHGQIRPARPRRGPARLRDLAKHRNSSFQSKAGIALTNNPACRHPHAKNHLARDGWCAPAPPVLWRMGMKRPPATYPPQL